YAIPFKTGLKLDTCFLCLNYVYMSLCMYVLFIIEHCTLLIIK
ncbi:hypothetical protein AAJ76_1030002, partial [Vairimorpha ceranae]